MAYYNDKNHKDSKERKEIWQILLLVITLRSSMRSASLDQISSEYPVLFFLLSPLTLTGWTQKVIVVFVRMVTRQLGSH